MSEVEREEIHQALKTARSNKTEAARILGLNRSSFYAKLRRLGMLDPEGS